MVDSKGLCGRWRLHLMGSWRQVWQVEPNLLLKYLMIIEINKEILNYIRYLQDKDDNSTVKHQRGQLSFTTIVKIVFTLIIYMKKFLHSDWLRAVKFFLKTLQKRVNSMQKEVTNQAFWLVNDERNTDGQSNILLSNQAHALDGAIDGVIDGTIFLWLRAFLLLNHLEIFSCILLISNHMIFLVQFGINKHL